MKVSFNGYKSILKTDWKKGLLPNVKRGLYGDVLTKSNVSLDHLRPVSKGGKTELCNLALASKAKNEARGNQDLFEVLTSKQAIDYLKQFSAYQNYRQYINELIRTFEKLGVL